MSADSPQSDDERLEEPSFEERSRLRQIWDQSWSYLAWGLVLSLLVHTLAMLVIMMAPSAPRADMDVEWLGRFGSLTGIGHGAEDFDPDQEIDWDELAEFTPEDEGAPEDEDVEEDEEEQAEEEPEESDTTQESAVAQAKTESEKEPEEGPGEGPPEPSEEEVAQTDEKEAEPEPEPKPRQAKKPDEIPGVDRSSPSNLPDLRNYGPGNARMTALVRLDRLRGTVIEPHVNTLLRVVPDYRILLDGTNINPVEELDAIFMASADPTHLHETFLAVRHRFETSELQELLDSRFADRLDWEVDGERPLRRLVPETGRYRDPRRLLLANEGLALVGKPEWFSELLGPVDPNSDLGRELASAEGGPSAYQLLDGLSRIEEIADQEDTLVLVSAYGLIFFAPGIGRLPRFEAVRLAVTNPDRPQLTIDLRFATSALARDFARDCPRMQRQIVGGIPGARLLGIASLVERLECTQEGDYVVVKGQYTTREVASLLQVATPLMPRPPALTGLPPGPLPLPTTSPGAADDEEESE